MKFTLAAILMASSLTLPAQAGGPRYRHYYRDEVCTKTVTKEIYHPPGSNGNPYSRGWIEYDSYDVQIPCRGRRRYFDDSHIEPDTNDCREGTAIGALLGGAGAAAISENDAYIWSIPLGIVGGAMEGCQIDGG